MLGAVVVGCRWSGRRRNVVVGAPVVLVGADVVDVVGPVVAVRGRGCAVSSSRIAWAAKTAGDHEHRGDDPR